MRYILIMLSLISAPATAQTAPSGDRTAPSDDWQIISTHRPVDDVVGRLKTGVASGGGSVVAVVDHAANARRAGTRIPATVLVVFGNPKLGTPLIARNRLIAIDLPQRMLVWRDGGATKVGYLRPSTLAVRYAFDADDSAIVAMDRALSKLAANAAGS